MGTLTEYLKKNNALPCLYFSFSRRRCEDLAQEVGFTNFLNSEEQERITALFNELVEKFDISPLPTSASLYPLIRKRHRLPSRWPASDTKRNNRTAFYNRVNKTDFYHGDLCS